MDLGELIKWGAEGAKVPEVREQAIERRSQGGLARHGDRANPGQRNWRYLLVDHGGADQGEGQSMALRVNDGGPHCKQWNLKATTDGDGYHATRVGDLPGTWNKATGLRHPEDGETYQEGRLQVHRADQDHLYATMQDGKHNGTFSLRRHPREDNAWHLRFEGRPANEQDTLRDFIKSVKTAARSHFHGTENDDVVDRDEGDPCRWKLIAGANDWECGTTNMSVETSDYGRTRRVWIELDNSSVGGNDDDEHTAEDEKKVKAWGEKAQETWVREAKKLYRPGSVDWAAAFWEAANGAAIKLYVKECGRDAQEWVDKTETTKQASAFIHDVRIDDLPADTRRDIDRFIPFGKSKGMTAVQYGMVVRELLPKADPHNLRTARAHLRDESDAKLKREFYAQKDKKFILLMFDAIVDGHHFLAKAERVGCTSSLNVLDLTGCRHQMGKKAEYETSHTKTMPDGRKLDVLRLQQLVSRLKERQVSLDDIKGVSRSARSGFSLDRYQNTDTSYPLILDPHHHLLDGRHRYLRHQDAGSDMAPVVRATPRIIEAATMKEAAGLGELLFAYSEQSFDLSKQAGGGTDGKLSCLMADVASNDPLYSELREFARDIADDDLYVGKDGLKEGGEFGREDHPHVTVLYGFKDADPEPVKKFVATKAPLRITLDGLSAFEGAEKGKDYDVLKFDVSCDALTQLNKELKEKFNVESSFPTYHPHLTVAYVKAGRSAKYANRTKLVGSAYTCSELTWSDPKKVHTTLKLEGTSKTAADGAPNNALDNLSYPLTGPLGKSTLAAAGIGAGVTGIQHAYRAIRQKFVGGPKQQNSLLQDMGHGAMMGTAMNVGLKGIGLAMGDVQSQNDLMGILRHIPGTDPNKFPVIPPSVPNDHPVPYERPPTPAADPTGLPGVGLGNYFDPTMAPIAAGAAAASR